MEGGHLEHPGRWYYAPLGTGCWKTKFNMDLLVIVPVHLALAFSISGPWRCCEAMGKKAEIWVNLESQKLPPRAPLRSGRVTFSK